VKEEEIIELWFVYIANGTYCPQKAKIVEIAEFWTKMTTGRSQDDIIIKFRPNESKQQKQQRINVTNTHTRYFSERIKTIYREVDRTDGIKDTLEYPDVEASQAKLKVLTDSVENYYGADSIDRFNDDYLLSYAGSDPNAFLLTNFKEFDADTEKPEVYPTIISSQNIRSYGRDNNLLNHLAFDESFQIKDKTAGIHYLFTKGFSYKLTEVIKGIDVEGKEIITLEQYRTGDVGFNAKIKGKKETQYIYEQFDSKMDSVPAIQFGWVRSIEHNDELILESYLLPAKELLIESIKDKSELDLTLTLHGIAKEIAYVPACNYKADNHKVCQGGIVNGSNCPKCSGTGKMPIHRSTQDILTIELPFDPSSTMDAEIIDVSKLHQYIEIPANIIELLERRQEKGEAAIALALFNKNVFNQENMASIAVEAIIQNNKSVYNALYSYAAKRAEITVHQRECAAIYTDTQEGLINKRKYPSDFKLESLGELLTWRKMATDAGASIAILRKIDQAIMSKQNINEPKQFARLKSIEHLKPYYDRSESERLATVMLLPSNDIKRIAFLYFDDIIADMDTDPTYKDWAGKPYQEQRSIFSNIAEGYKERFLNSNEIEEPIEDIELT
jgi:hypothetical protein